MLNSVACNHDYNTEFRYLIYNSVLRYVSYAWCKFHKTYNNVTLILSIKIVPMVAMEDNISEGDLTRLLGWCCRGRLQKLKDILEAFMSDIT